MGRPPDRFPATRTLGLVGDGRLTARRLGTTSPVPQRHGGGVDLTTSAVANLTQDQPRRPVPGAVDYRIGTEPHTGPLTTTLV
jgi:hypothetical protein